jgi:ATP-binding protein involved in chromosome partitioning
MSKISEDEILNVLRPIQDPDFKRSIVDLGFVKSIRIEGGRISFAIELTTPACPVKEQFKDAAEKAVLSLPGVDEVEVTMTASTRGSAPPDRSDMLRSIKNVIAVASGKGGVGKSTVAVNLALALQKLGGRVGLLDCDIYGPSIPLMLNVSGMPQVTQERKIIPKESYGLELMSIGFLAADNAPVINGRRRPHPHPGRAAFRGHHCQHAAGGRSDRCAQGPEDVSARQRARAGNRREHELLRLPALRHAPCPLR